MNAKKEIILELNARIAHYENYKRYQVYDSDSADRQIKLFKDLIDATEAAIFDVPTDDEIRKQASTFGLCFGAAMDMHNFILNYKPESDGK